MEILQKMGWKDFCLGIPTLSYPTCLTYLKTPITAQVTPPASLASGSLPRALRYTQVLPLQGSRCPCWKPTVPRVHFSACVLYFIRRKTNRQKSAVLPWYHGPVISTSESPKGCEQPKRRECRFTSLSAVSPGLALGVRSALVSSWVGRDVEEQGWGKYTP